MTSVANLIIRKWWICAGLALVMTGLATRGMMAPRSSAEMGEVKSAYVLKSKLDEEFGSDGGDCLIVVDVGDRDGTLFTARRLEVLRDVREQVEGLEVVENVVSLDDITTVSWFGRIGSLMPKEGTGEAALERAGRRAAEHPLGRQILSTDQRTLIMPVLFTQEAMMQPFMEKLQAVRRAVEGAGGKDQLRVRLTGLFPLWAAEQAAVNRDRMKFIIIGYVLTSALAIYLFRSLLVTAAIGLPVLLGVFWALGTLMFFNHRPTPLTQVVMPMMLTMVGFSDAVHLMFHIRRARWRGDSRRGAAISAVRDLGVPCGLTSLTTAVGFASLMVAEAEVIRSFGMACAIGVVLTFFAVVTLVPLLSLTRLGKNVHLSHEHDFMERHGALAERVIRFLLAKAQWVVAGAAVLMVVFGCAAATLRPDTQFSSRLPDRSEAYQALEHVDEHLSGVQVMRVSLRWDQAPVAEAVVVQKLEQVTGVLRAEDLLGEPMSLLSVLEALPGREAAGLAARMGKLRHVPDEVVAQFYKPEDGRATVAVRVQDLGIARYKPVFDRIDERLATLQEPGLEIAMTGDPVIWGRYLDRMVTDLLKSLALASVVILIVMGIVYRSVKIGLIAIVPNLFPLAATGAMLAIFDIPLVIETVCAFTICLGIAVDDTVHFMSRFRLEHLRGGTGDEAIKQSFLKVGSPLVVTTLLMVTGFATVLWSELPGFRMFGAMACATLAAAFVADLVILPALLKIFGRGFDR